ncbi:MAG: hypothetical protein P0Y48_11050 [Candidatus Microbacterium phytovorans]|uniref:Uncharacterized protein n=1 Tax=Candidatus Microbacterium phytovorans TaxID=3121374 RepID=A0AAJ6B2L0_9MICO|nr:hypothetical protein [Microbacterium sp.]WEK12995.1 MAG: hypothetical protein P0Y48_11050 [Microbacterium sp.]
MGDNTAHDLADLLESWTIKDGTPIQARGGTGSGNLVFWREQARAVEQIRALDEAAERLAGTRGNFFKAAAEQWYRAAFSFAHPWNNKGNVGAPPPEATAMLRSLGVSLEMASSTRPPLLPAQAREMSDVIDEAVKLLRETEDVSEPERLYVFEMLTATRRLLEERDLVDHVDLQRHIDQLLGTLTRLAATFQEAESPETASKFSDLARRFYTASRSVVYDLAAVAAIASASTDVINAITSS